MRPEPLPVLSIATWIWLNLVLYSAKSYEDLWTDSDIVIQLKHENFVWLILLNLSICILNIFGNTKHVFETVVSLIFLSIPSKQNYSHRFFCCGYRSSCCFLFARQRLVGRLGLGLD